MDSEEFSMPEGLDRDGKKAYEAIMNHLRSLDNEGFQFYTGGCRTFYSPGEWEDRGEEYGKGSVLIVVYDGGYIRPFFNMDASCEAHGMLVEAASEFGTTVTTSPYDACEGMQEALKKAGFYYEECTGWYAAVYRNGHECR